MTEKSVAVRNANLHFRKEEQAKEGAAAWKDYADQQEATQLKTARLRAQRLARQAVAAATAVPLPKRVTRIRAAKKIAKS